jgi:site-specific recombinase XerD
MTAQPLATVDDRPRLIALEGFRERAERYADARRAPGTRYCYKRDFAEFTAWCHTHGMVPLPALASAVAMFITACADRGLSSSSIGRRLAAIAAAHRDVGIESADLPTRHPVVARVYAGIRREHGVAPVKKDAIVVAQLRDLVAPLRYSPKDVRDRAILLVGFAGAFRRSEIVSFNASDVRFVDDGLMLNLRQSKTDQEGAGALVCIAYGSHLPTCPVRALEAWMELTGAVDDEPLFRRVASSGRIGSQRLTPQSVAIVVKRHAALAGLDPKTIGGHSLRAGFVTTCALAGMSENKIMRQSRHRSSATLRGYMRPATGWVDNASADVGL